MEEEQKTPVFALDIGTRSIVGVVGEPWEGRLKVLAVETAEHDSRTMMDGQIDDIRQVGRLARNVTERLEEQLGISLKRVCVAAAGRALRTQKGSFALELPEEQVVDHDFISRLEAGAVSQAEEALQSGGQDWKQLFLVGYTVSQYRLDNYPLTVLEGHRGRRAEVDVVATFLPEEVIESLYAAMHEAGLQVASMTLEPIAAMNAAIPAELRLLNLALVDIGAGTTDIAICQGGSVVGYTMATIAGDEITEAIMKACLVDFATAETMKRTLGEGEAIPYTDILGLENRISRQDLEQIISQPLESLSQAIAKQILEVNQTAPSAVFLAGGGSKLRGLRERVAASLEMEEKRVAITGSNFSRSAFSDTLKLDNPEYTTPLGLAVSVGLGLLNDSYRIQLNGEAAKLFRSGVLTVQDVLLMNGYTYSDMMGRSGKSLNLTLDGRHVLLRGEPYTPAILKVNGQETGLGTVVNAGDRIDFVPARQGRNAASTLGDLLLEQQAGQDGQLPGRVLVNNREADAEQQLADRDEILVLERAPRLPEQPAEPSEELEPAEKTVEQIGKEPETVPEEPTARTGATLRLTLNEMPLTLPAKESGQPYYLMDLLEYSGIDFAHLDRPVRLTVNGHDGTFREVLQEQDQVEIVCL